MNDAIFDMISEIETVENRLTDGETMFLNQLNRKLNIKGYFPMEFQVKRLEQIHGRLFDGK